MSLADCVTHPARPATSLRAMNRYVCIDGRTTCVQVPYGAVRNQPYVLARCRIPAAHQVVFCKQTWACRHAHASVARHMSRRHGWEWASAYVVNGTHWQHHGTR